MDIQNIVYKIIFVLHELFWHIKDTSSALFSDYNIAIDNK